MALQLILAREAVIAAVLAPNHRARVKFLRVGAMLDGVMTEEIGPSFACEGADVLNAAECCFAAFFVEMASFVQDVVTVALGEKGTVWEPAGHAVVRPIFEGADGETCDAGAYIVWFLGQSVSNDGILVQSISNARFQRLIGLDPCVRHVPFDRRPPQVHRSCCKISGVKSTIHAAFHAL